MNPGKLGLRAPFLSLLTMGFGEKNALFIDDQTNIRTRTLGTYEDAKAERCPNCGLVCFAGLN